MSETTSSNVARGAALIVGALLLALGIYAGGFFIGQGIANWNSGRRINSVKGLSEREVPASVAVWTIGYVASGNDLDAINRKLGDSTKAVVAFLKHAGFEEKDMAVQPPALRDASMEPREKDTPPPPERFRAEQSVLLRTSKVDLIKPALASASTLMTNGVLLSGGCQPNYLYNQLNEIKPTMIQEATKNARVAADQFSRDSQTRLGKLRNATLRRRSAKWLGWLSMWITKSINAAEVSNSRVAAE
ncbi:MAG: SIMPL domain-containing protein [Verrucomicrobia bacterium]|nr:MAG: SIMPL domain-containing protein [Verrucomicrobiota bacterium]